MESQTKTTAPAIIHKLVETFEQNLDSYRSSKNETELRREFLDKFFTALGWDVANEKGYDESRAIDSLVYELYGLSEEEIKMVEGT